MNSHLTNIIKTALDFHVMYGILSVCLFVCVCVCVCLCVCENVRKVIKIIEYFDQSHLKIYFELFEPTSHSYSTTVFSSTGRPTRNK